jgi:uncharacterized cupin superfamily protein
MMNHNDALAIEIPLEPVPSEQRVGGDPMTGVVSIGTFGGHEFGVWEMTDGTMSDVEVDEVFVVLRGRATVEFLDDASAIELAPGSVCVLTAGARTRWTVSETIRKMWFTSEA